MKFADVKNDIAFRKIFGNEQKTAFMEADKYKWSKMVINLHNEGKTDFEIADLLDIPHTI